MNITFTNHTLHECVEHEGAIQLRPPMPIAPFGRWKVWDAYHGAFTKPDSAAALNSIFTPGNIIAVEIDPKDSHPLTRSIA
jgi:hypothetical protein